MIIFYFLAAILVGIGQPVQAGINARLKSHLGDPAWATFVSVVVSSTTITLYLLIRRVPPPSRAAIAAVPWWGWTGGVLGVAFVLATLVVTPKVGAGLAFSLIVCGQMAAGLALDQWGLIGLPIHHAGPLRILGMLLVIGGVVLVRAF